ASRGGHVARGPARGRGRPPRGRDNRRREPLARLPRHHAALHQAHLRDSDQPIDHLGLPGLQPGLADHEHDTVSRLLRDGGLLLRDLVQDQRVRARFGDRGRDGRDHGADQRLLRPADGQARRRRVSSPLAGAPIAGLRPVRRRSRRARARRWGVDALGGLVFLGMIFPVYWMASPAFKPGSDIIANTPVWFPTHPTLSNFSDAIHRPYFWTSVKNSLIVVVSVVVISLVLAFLAALALAKFRFYGRKAFIVLVIGVQMVPLNALLIPIYLVLSNGNQGDKRSGLVIRDLTLVLPVTIWTLRGFLLGVPQDLEEAAQVDGSTRFGAFVRILLPLIGPGLVATSIFAFIQAWNEYLMASVLIHSGNKQTLTLWLASFTTDRGTAWGPLMASATLTPFPPVLFFVAIQRRVP